MNCVYYIWFLLMSGFKCISLVSYSTKEPHLLYMRNTSNYYNSEFQQMKQFKENKLQAATITRNGKDLNVRITVPEIQQKLNQRHQNCHAEPPSFVAGQRRILCEVLTKPLPTATALHIESRGYSDLVQTTKLPKSVASYSAASDETLNCEHLDHTYSAKSLFNVMSSDMRYVKKGCLSKNKNNVKRSIWYYGHKNEYGTKEFSQQLLYSPKRSRAESKLTLVNKIVPYPPSFITFTTTKAPLPQQPGQEIESGGRQFTSQPIRFYVPDFFANQQFKSLMDSYIPSWQVIKMVQHYNLQFVTSMQKEGDLHTLAFAVPFKKNQ